MNKQQASRASLLLISLLCLAASGGVQAKGCEVGVNVNSFQNFDAAAQEVIVGQLSAAGVHCVRTSMRPDDKNLRLMKAMQDKEIGLVLDVGAQFGHDAKARPANAQHHMRAALPLSAMDVKLSRAYFQNLFDKLDENGIELAGIEFGNEVNWTDFNGDFPVPGKGKAFTLQDLARDPEGQQVARGFDQYLKVLVALKEVRDHSRRNRGTPLISAGMVAVNGGPWQQKLGVDGVSLPATYAYLRAHGLDKLVDGYGVHEYPAVVKPGDKTAVDQRLALLDTQVFPPGNTKPYWLTEWGFPAKTAADEQTRARSVTEIRAYLNHLFKAGRLKGIFWYVWNEPDQDSIYRDDALMESGKRATAPAP